MAVLMREKVTKWGTTIKDHEEMKMEETHPKSLDLRIQTIQNTTVSLACNFIEKSIQVND
jgi:hypothetical protein